MSPSDGEQEEEGAPGYDLGCARFRVLYDQSLPRVFSFITRALAPQVADADDLVAEVYLVAWRRIDDVPASPEDLLWLFGVARNVVAHHRRSTALRLRLQNRLDRERPVHDANVEVPNEVLVAVQHLPHREREALHLVVWEGLRTEDAAKVIGCSPNAVRIRVHRARRRLTDRLGSDDPLTDRDLSASALNWESP
jgi:RNA polymerase sigma factor (sigma-70 family)